MGKNIKRYKKKPIIIEAIQYDGHNLREIAEFVGTDLSMIDDDVNLSLFPVIKTLEGDMKISKGDYIIKGVQGEFYPCKPDIFEQTYELANNFNTLDNNQIQCIKNELTKLINDCINNYKHYDNPLYRYELIYKIPIIFNLYNITFPVYVISNDSFNNEFIPNDDTYWLNIQNKYYIAPIVGRKLEHKFIQGQGNIVYYINDDKEVKDFWYNLVKDIKI